LGQTFFGILSTPLAEHDGTGLVPSNFPSIAATLAEQTVGCDTHLELRNVRASGNLPVWRRLFALFTEQTEIRRMENSDADRNLLFGMLALQNGLVDQVQLVAAFQSWTLQKERPLANHLVDRGALDAAQRGVIEAMVGLHLQKHGGRPAQSVSEIQATMYATGRSLAQLADPELAASLSGLLGRGPGAGLECPTEPDLGPGLDAPNGGPNLAGLGAKMGTVLAHVTLHDTDEDDRTLIESSGDGARCDQVQAGRYQLIGEIARGGMGSVFKGRDPDLGRELAVKVLLDPHCDQSELISRFVEEAQICGQLQHPGVVPVYDLGTLGDRRPFFAMKLVKGRTLAAILAGRSSPSDDLPRLLSIFEAICQTMAYAHARGVIHRDLKPSNVMVGRFGEVLVMDWGLAKILPKDGPKREVVSQPATQTIVARVGSQGETDLTVVGSAMGTPAYMAPEQARGEIDAIDRRTDVFALGSILCEILTGEPAFTGNKSIEILKAAGRAETAAALDRLDHCGADDDLLAIARDCLAADAKDRPADAGVLAERVTGHLAGVQERLREAELSRVEAQAHAEEETKRRALAEQLANVERGRAEEATRRAALERNRRRLQLGLAASLLALTTAGGLGTTYFLQQRQAKAAAVQQILGRASTLRDLARQHAGDPARWHVALAAIDQAERALGGDALAQKRVEALRAEVVDGTGAAERDRQLMERMVDIRSAEADDRGGWSTDAAYADAFREAGLDISAMPSVEAAKRIKARPPEVAMAMAIALDDWAAVRRDRKKDNAGAALLSAAASLVDADTWRSGLRQALDLPDPAARLGALQKMAKATPFETLGPISLDLLGRALKDAGDPTRSEALLRRAQHLHPGDVWINYDLARVLEKLARRDEAIRFYTAARSLRRETAHELAHILEAKGEPAEAVAILEDLRQQRPDSGRHLGCLGRALGSRGRSPEAKAVLAAAEAANREAVRKRPEDALAHASLGFSLYMQGKLNDAVPEYRAAIRIQPGNAEFHDTLSEILGKQGKVDQAIAEHHKAIRIQPDFANAYNTLGDILFSVKQDYAGAATAFGTATRLQPDNAVYHYNLGLALQGQEKLGEATAEYRLAAQLKPNYADAYLGIGEILEAEGRVDQAIVEYRAAAGLHADDAYAHLCIARALLRKPNRSAPECSEALEHAGKATALKPEDGTNFATLALAEYRAGHWPESVAAADRSVDLAKGVDATNGFILAMAHWQQGSKDRSRAYFDQAKAWTRKNDPKKADLLQLWREAAGLLDLPGPDGPG
jgi:serine/threonine-protein kinase